MPFSTVIEPFTFLSAMYMGSSLFAVSSTVIIYLFIYFFNSNHPNVGAVVSYCAFDLDFQ